MPLSQKILQYIILSGITVLALAVMAFVTIRSTGSAKKNPQAEKISLPRSLVTVQKVTYEPIDVYDTYSGKIEPLERYSLGFEIAGRIREFGKNAQGKPLDEGDEVEKGDVLAQLDDRILIARQKEASSRLEQAESNLARTEKVRLRDPRAITATELQDRLTEVALMKAARDMTAKNLQDATLVAPVRATISKRMAQIGESVNPHEIIFELVELHKVLLVLGVPESRIPEIELRQKQIRENRSRKDIIPVDPQDLEFRVEVELLSKNRFGKPWPSTIGSVKQISETADETSGMFEVEVELDNPDRLIRPGMVARARIMIAHIRGYRVPTTSVVFRQDEAYLFTIEPAGPEAIQQATNGSKKIATPLYKVRKRKLDLWVEQGDYIVVPEQPTGFTRYVTRGQHRLVDGQLVEIVSDTDSPPVKVEQETDLSARLPVEPMR